MEILDYEAVRKYIPARDPWGHKGTFGKLLLLCGSTGFTGAAALASRAALRTGAGLVFLGVPQSIYAIEAVKLEEPVVFPLPERDGKLSEAAIPEILHRLSSMDACLIGPGLGQSEDVAKVVRAVLEEAKCPVVLDADGINVLASHMDILRGRTAPTILTPHDGEFARIYPQRTQDRQQDALDFAKTYGVILLRKGHRTLITDGTRMYENHTGNSGMAVGGSGDVLSGILTALCGFGMEPLLAAACGAWLHGAAGDLGAKTWGEYGLLPSDVVEALPRLLK